MQIQISEMPAGTGTRALEGSPRKEGDAVSIIAVVVLYKTHPSDSVTLKTLYASAEHLLGRPGSDSIRLQVLVADNTPGGQGVKELPGAGEYRAFPGNPGLAPVYNQAITQAKEGFDWLLTLDQDTHLPPAFLASMAKHASRHKQDEQVAAIVPRVFDGVRPVSPFLFVRGFPRIVGGGVSGVLAPHASAINSASLLRISALKSVGGYDERFPLNNSDTALFERLDRAGYRIALAGDVTVNHELAMTQRHDRMTLERYRQLLKDERDFWDLHMGRMARVERTLRLAARLVKSYLGSEDKDFRKTTANELRYRLLTSRAERIRGGALPGRSS